MAVELIQNDSKRVNVSLLGASCHGTFLLALCQTEELAVFPGCPALASVVAGAATVAGAVVEQASRGQRRGQIRVTAAVVSAALATGAHIHWKQLRRRPQEFWNEGAIRCNNYILQWYTV